MFVIDGTAVPLLISYSLSSTIISTISIIFGADNNNNAPAIKTSKQKYQTYQKPECKWQYLQH